MFYLYRLSINPTRGAERLPERHQVAFCQWIVFGITDQDADAPRLLRLRGERPRGRNRNSCNELAPSH